MLAPAQVRAVQGYKIGLGSRRFLVGCVGGCLPTLAQVSTLGAPGNNFDPLAPVSWLTAAALVLLGGIVAWLHEELKKLMPLAEIGILAPTIVFAVLNGNVVKSTSDDLIRTREQLRDAQNELTRPRQSSTREQSFQMQFAYLGSVGSAARQGLNQQEPKRFSPPQEDWTEQLVRDLTGRPPTRVWFVVASSHENLSQAVAALQDPVDRGFDAAVYEPSNGYPNFAVVIGANLGLDQAEELARRAIAGGLPGTRKWVLATT
jgi:hypothetical protein